MHYIFPVCLISCCSALNRSPSHCIGVLSGLESCHGAQKILMPDIFRERNFCPYGVLRVRPDSPLLLSPLPFCGSGCIHFSDITKPHKPWLLVNKTFSKSMMSVYGCILSNISKTSILSSTMPCKLMRNTLLKFYLPNNRDALAGVGDMKGDERGCQPPC